MVDDGRPRVTLCAILREILETSGDDKIKALAVEATAIAKKMDLKLKIYSRASKNLAQEIITDNWHNE